MAGAGWADRPHPGGPAAAPVPETIFGTEWQSGADRQVVTGQATSRAMAGCAALALYFLAVAVVGEWDLAVAGAVALFAGVL